MDRLGTAGEAIQPLFITLDPEKDTPDQLKGYVALFHPRLIGLTGAARQIRQVARAYKVTHPRCHELGLLPSPIARRRRA